MCVQGSLAVVGPCGWYACFLEGKRPLTYQGRWPLDILGDSTGVTSMIVSSPASKMRISLPEGIRRSPSGDVSLSTLLPVSDHGAADVAPQSVQVLTPLVVAEFPAVGS
jgi:hypothetical protein